MKQSGFQNTILSAEDHTINKQYTGQILNQISDTEFIFTMHEELLLLNVKKQVTYLKSRHVTE
jgi:histidinol phosphatase-like enzyme